MTKARTKGQKIAEKKARAGLPELEPVPRKKRRGKARMGDIGPKEAGDVQTLETRARHAGQAIVRVDPAEQDKAKRRVQRQIRADQLRDMRAPWRGCEAGRSMASVVTDEKARAVLWGAIQHMRRVQANYDRSIGAPNRHAQCLRLLLPLDEMTADASTPPIDLRTDEDKRRQAVSAWMAMQGWLGYTGKDAASICKATVIDDDRCADAASLVVALHCVADGISGRRMVYRSVDALG